MAKKVAINGFGRIGRLAFRSMFTDKDLEVVAINDLTDTKTLAHLLKYDSAQGNFKVNEITFDDDSISIGTKKVLVFKERDPKDLPWKKLGVDIVLEATGFFTKRELAQKHIDAGAKKVVISAPAQGDLKTIVFNVNHKELAKDDTIVSAASCTTNCLAPVAKVLDDAFGLKSGFMTTIHSITNDQTTVDAPHGDLRRARAAGQNIIPTTTGAAAAVGKVLPSLNGKLDGNAMRVPTLTGSVVDLVFTLDKEATVEDINGAMKKAANETLGFTMDPIVSSDVIGSSFGSLFDGLSTKVMKSESGETLYKIVTWYDNEMSYVNQFVRTTKFLAKL